MVGFAAETNDVEKFAAEKLARKGCDWLVANQVGEGIGFDQDENQVSLLRYGPDKRVIASAWPMQSKQEIARRLVQEISIFLKTA